MKYRDEALRTFCRRLEILNFIKQHRQACSVMAITEHLIDSGLLDLPTRDSNSPDKSQLRKIQRDLQFLAGDESSQSEEGDNFNEFGLTKCAGGRHSYRWQIAQDPDIDFNWSTMPDHMAVTLALAEKHLASAMPSRYHQLLRQHYKTARHKLVQASKKYQPKQLQHLVDSVAVDQRGLRLEAAQIDEQILDTIYEALILRRRLQIRYKNKLIIIHPHGVVIARPKMYLLALKDVGPGNEKLRSYLIHRIQSINLLKQSAQLIANFKLQDYLAEGLMDVMIDKDIGVYQLQIKLQPDAQSNLLLDLYETPIAPDQQIMKSTDGSYLLTANVHRSYQLLNWIISLGQVATILRPACIRKDVIRHVQQIAANYQIM